MTTTMAPPVFLLGQGNHKLGVGFIFSWSVPAIETCPGRSKLCQKACYAKRGLMLLQHKRRTYHKRLAASKRDDFVERMILEIRFRDVRVLRIHCSGDFYSVDYIRKWREIISRCPQTRFFCYTRSWRVDPLRRELNRLALLKNCRMWFSCDQETGLPSLPAKRVRLAWMAVTDDDVPPRTPDLSFRVRRSKVVKRLGGAVVCPAENGVTRMTCQRCALCWDPLEKTDARRLALPMAS